LTIRTRYNNQSFDIKSAGKTNNMQIWSTNSGWFQIFKFEKSQFINWTNNKVLDVTNSKDEEGNPVGVAENTGKNNQKWRVVYLDKAKAIETKGLNEEFGFHINRPFYIRSRLPMQRVIECHGANNVWLKRWRKNTTAQQWYFDEVSKTIKNNHWKSHSLDIQGNGASSNVRCTTTNSRWW
jgi:bacillopeptidase F (M6 metalloprotease family)